MRVFPRILTAALISLLVVAVACTSDDNDPTAAPAPTATPDEVVTDDHDDADDDHADDEHEDGDAGDTDLVALGREVYGAVGCAACHGVDAEGNEIGPALSGHNELQVRRQVRAPIGVMTVFDQSMLSTGDLDALVAYVESLGGGHAHDAPDGLATAEQSFMHHRMALTAFESENFAEAEHHLEHLSGVLEGQHLALMQEALEATHAGEYHDAQHLVEGMLADVLPPDQNIVTLHNQLALAGLRTGDTEGAIHHLEHVEADSVDANAQGEVGEILGFISEGLIDEAEEHLSLLMGLDPAGVDAGHLDDGHDDEAAHVDGDDHVVDEHAEEEAAHVDGDDHAVDEHGEEEAAHVDGDDHAVDEHGEEEAAHVDGDEHAVDEHAEEEEGHVDSDEHAVDEHAEEEEGHVDGDEHAADEHAEEEETHVEGDEHADDEHEE